MVFVDGKTYLDSVKYFEWVDDPGIIAYFTNKAFLAAELYRETKKIKESTLFMGNKTNSLILIG